MSEFQNHTRPTGSPTPTPQAPITEREKTAQTAFIRVITTVAETLSLLAGSSDLQFNLQSIDRELLRSFEFDPDTAAPLVAVLRQGASQSRPDGGLQEIFSILLENDTFAAIVRTTFLPTQYYSPDLPSPATAPLMKLLTECPLLLDVENVAAWINFVINNPSYAAATGLPHNPFFRTEDGEKFWKKLCDRAEDISTEGKRPLLLSALDARRRSLALTGAPKKAEPSTVATPEELEEHSDHLSAVDFSAPLFCLWRLGEKDLAALAATTEVVEDVLAGRDLTAPAGWREHGLIAPYAGNPRASRAFIQAALSDRYERSPLIRAFGRSVQSNLVNQEFVSELVLLGISAFRNHEFLLGVAEHGLLFSELHKYSPGELRSLLDLGRNPPVGSEFLRIVSKRMSDPDDGGLWLHVLQSGPVSSERRRQLTLTPNSFTSAPSLPALEPQETICFQDSPIVADAFAIVDSLDRSDITALAKFRISSVLKLSYWMKRLTTFSSARWNPATEDGAARRRAAAQIRSIPNVQGVLRALAVHALRFSSLPEAQALASNERFKVLLLSSLSSSQIEGLVREVYPADSDITAAVLASPPDATTQGTENGLLKFFLTERKLRNAFGSVRQVLKQLSDAAQSEQRKSLEGQ